VIVNRVINKYIGLDRGSATEITHVNLTAFSVHHDGDGEALLVVQPPDAVNNLLVPLPRAVAHVDSRHVHASNSQGLQLLEPARGGAHRAYQLRPPRAAEPVLLKLRLRHGVHLDGARIGERGRDAVVVRDEDFRGGGGTEVGETAVAREEKVGRGERGVGGNGGGGRGEEAEIEGMRDRHGGAWQREREKQSWTKWKEKRMRSEEKVCLTFWSAGRY